MTTTVIAAGDRVVTRIDMQGTDSLSILEGGQIFITNDDSVRFDAPTSGATITNAGSLTNIQNGGRTFLFATGIGSSLTASITNSGTVDSLGQVILIETLGGGAQVTSGALTVVNSGTLFSRNAAATLDFSGGTGAFTAAVQNSFVIYSDLGDGIRFSGRGELVNTGQVIGGVGSGYTPLADGVRFAANATGFVTNTQIPGGLSAAIMGDTNGISTGIGSTITITNNVDAFITGGNGAGIAAQGNATVTNYGNIGGNLNNLPGVAGDGDGIDIDGQATIINHGAIQGSGAVGNDSNGQANRSQGISFAGGTVTNTLETSIIAGRAEGILADDGAGGNALYASVITNYGSIQGDQDGIRLINALDDVITNHAYIYGFNGVALSTGGGNDVVNNHGLILGFSAVSVDVDLGAGNDTFNHFDGSYSLIKVEGGAGIDTLSLAGVATAGQLNTIVLGDRYFNFERVIGSSNADDLTGAAAAETLDGGAGQDRLQGGAGNDVLMGGAGADDLTGGADADTFVFVRSQLVAGANDTVNDYSAAEGDVLRVMGGTLAEVALTGTGLTRSLDVGTATNVLTMTAAGNVVVQWYATEAATTLANGAVRTYDAGDSGEWASYTHHFDSQNRFDYETGTYDGGARAGGSWKIDTDQAGDQYFQWLRDEYDSAGQRVQQSGLSDDGRGWETLFSNGVVTQQKWTDVIGGFEWASYTDVYAPNGALDYQTGTYDSGPRAGGTWSYDADQAGNQYFQWYRNEYTGTGQLYEQSGLRDDGRVWQLLMSNGVVTQQKWTDGAGTEDWASYTDYYTASGAFDYQTGIYDGTWRAGGSWKYDADQAGDQPFQWVRDEFNYAGQIYQQFGQADGGNTWEALFSNGVKTQQKWTDVLGFGDWASYTDHYTATGAFDYQTGIYDGTWRAGGSWKYDVDQAGDQPFQWVRDELNSAGQRYQQFGQADNGNTWEALVANGVLTRQTWTDASGTSEWSTYTDVNTATGTLDYQSGTYDSGWRAGGSWTYDVDQNNDSSFLAWYRNEYNSAGQVYQQFGATDDGRTWESWINSAGASTFHRWTDVANAYSWASYTDTLGNYGNGLTWHRVGLNDNGSVIDLYY